MDRAYLKEKIKQTPILWKCIHYLVVPPMRSYFRYFPVQPGKQALWRSISPHTNWLESWADVETVFGSKIRVHSNDDVGRCIYYFGVWEPNLTAWITRSLSPGDTFVDVGANIGYFSLLAAGLVGKQGSVVSIEAVPDTCKLLSSNLRLNGSDNVRVVATAAWDSIGSLDFFIPSDGISGTATAVKDWAERWYHETKVSVPCAPLSSILTKEEIKSARIVKIDIEGAEWNVIPGITELLQCGRQDLEIALEVTPESRPSGQSCADICHIFEKFGFHPYQIENVYGNLAFSSLCPVSPPRRVREIPEDKQSDIVFSRRDVDVL